MVPVNLVRKSDTLVIYGSGSSINSLNQTDLDYLNQFDSLGFNWFCKSGIPTKFYLIREQANIDKRTSPDETPEIFYNLLAKYKGSTKIIVDIADSSAWNYADHLNKIEGPGIVLKDIKLLGNADGMLLWKTFDINQGLIHGKNTLSSCMHFAVNLKYDKVIFVGVDLRDSRYFWLKEDESRLGKQPGARHATANITLDLVKRAKAFNLINMTTYNSNSLLSCVIPIEKKQ